MTDRRAMLNDEREALDAAWDAFTRVINAAPGTNEHAAYHSGFRNGWHAFALWRERGMAEYNAAQMRQAARGGPPFAPLPPAIANEIAGRRVTGETWEMFLTRVREGLEPRDPTFAIACAITSGGGLQLDAAGMWLRLKRDGATDEAYRSRLALAYRAQVEVDGSDASKHGDVRERRADPPAPAPTPGDPRPDPRERSAFSVDAVIGARASGIELPSSRIGEQLSKQDAQVDAAVRDLLAAGVPRSEIEILISWGDIVDDGTRVSITRTVQVRQRAR